MVFKWTGCHIPNPNYKLTDKPIPHQTVHRRGRDAGEARALLPGPHGLPHPRHGACVRQGKGAMIARTTVVCSAVRIVDVVLRDVTLSTGLITQQNWVNTRATTGRRGDAGGEGAGGDQPGRRHGHF